MNAEVWVSVLVFVSVMSIGGALVMVRAGRRQTLEARIQRSGGAVATGPVPDDSASMLTKVAQQVGGAVGPRDPSAALRKRLARAGYYSRSAVAVYLGAKMLLLMAGLIAGAAVLGPLEVGAGTKLMLVICAGGLGFYGPDLAVESRRSARAREVRNHLPDVVDLLEICVSAGMGLDMAWNSVTEEVRRVSGTLADEMSLTNLEVHLGASRAEAMRHMAERTGAEELSSMVAMLIQSERFGTSIRDALRTFATTMRELRSQRAEESAEKMAVKLLIPLVLFVFPPILIVTAGPATLKIVEIFSQ